MLTLTTPITIANVTKFRIRRLGIDEDNGEAYLMVEASGPGGKIYGMIDLVVRNGVGDRIRANPASMRMDDVLLVDRRAFEWATGYTDLATLPGGNPGARLRAAETACAAAGVFPAGSVA